MNLSGFSGEDVLEITVSSENQAAVASVAIIVSEINDPPSLDVQFPWPIRLKLVC